MEPWEIFQQKRFQDLRKAMDVLETLPGFAAAQVQRYEREKDALKILAADNPPLCSETRLEHVLKLLDIRTQPYLELVSGMPTLKAFTGLISEFANIAWEEQTGGPFYQQGTQFDRIETKVRDWLNEAYKRVAQGGTKQTERPSTPHKPTRRFSEPNLELLRHSETVNKKQAADALGVSLRTLDRYVADKRLTPAGGYSRRRFKTKDLLNFIGRKQQDN